MKTSSQAHGHTIIHLIMPTMLASTLLTLCLTSAGGRKSDCCLFPGPARSGQQPGAAEERPPWDGAAVHKARPAARDDQPWPRPGIPAAAAAVQLDRIAGLDPASRPRAQRQRCCQRCAYLSLVIKALLARPPGFTTCFGFLNCVTPPAHSRNAHTLSLCAYIIYSGLLAALLNKFLP